MDTIDGVLLISKLQTKLDVIPHHRVLGLEVHYKIDAYTLPFVFFDYQVKYNLGSSYLASFNLFDS